MLIKLTGLLYLVCGSRGNLAGVERREFDRSPDRSLLNVSPITDSGLNEVEVVNEESKVKKSVSVQIPEENRISPIYR